MQSKEDVVNHPKHYNNGKVECIEAIEAMLTPEEYLGYLRGNGFKYRWRCRYKGKTIEDLDKAEWYDNKAKQFILTNPNLAIMETPSDYRKESGTHR
jgi:hypothetical protein|tara:strand:- start:4368 stop:4658 length:291 start_codon:yes stop_codon:yes gene_type:complete